MVVDDAPKEGKEDSDPQLASFKLQYLQMGKKIQTLKTKKASLLKTIQAIPAPSEPRKILERLKQKY